MSDYLTKDWDEKEPALAAENAPVDSAAPEQTEEAAPPPEDAGIVVRITNDLMDAYVKFTEPKYGGNPPTEIEVLKALSLSHVTYGVHSALIEQICARPRYDHEIKIAEGVAPRKGEDAKLLLKVRIGEKPKPQEREDGSVDFSKMGIVTEVVRGQILCERTPPTEGIAGVNVLGKPVPAIKGFDKPIPSGANTAIMDEGRYLLAMLDGRVDLVADRITVSENMEINGDIDVKTGDVKFKGNILISGNVRPGRKVEATGNIEIFGMIEGGTVIAGGDITVRGGIVGGGFECFIQCQGTLNCRYMENISVIAIKDVRAQMILHSQVKCGNLIELYGGKAAVMGGESLCGGNIVLRNAGSAAHVKTVLEVGRDPTLVIRENTLNEEITSLNKTLADMDRLEGVLSRLKSLNRLSEDKLEALDSIQASRPSLENKVKMIQKELGEIKRKIWSTAPVEINVTGVAYPGVEIRIGESKVILDTAIRGKRFFRKDDIIVAK